MHTGALRALEGVLLQGARAVLESWGRWGSAETSALGDRQDQQRLSRSSSVAWQGEAEVVEHV